MKKRLTSREIKKDLRSIYADADGNVPDLTKLDKGKKSGLTSFLVKSIILLTVLCTIAWGGFFLFTEGLFQSGETLTLSIEGPDQVKAGEELSYTFRYENTGDVPVASLVMKLNVPESFHVYGAIPESDTTGEWTIGSLSAGSDGAVTITGVFLAEVPSSQRLQALFTYKPANFSSEFQDIVTQKVDIEDSVVALSFTGPEKALVGDTSEYVINIQNTGPDPIYNLRVVPYLSVDFPITSTEPAVEEGQTYWSIDQLQPGELTAITITGSFTSTASGEQTLGVSTGFVADDLYMKQVSEELVTDVLGGSVAYSVIVNGSSSSQSAELGDSLRLSLDYANNGADSVEGLSFDLELSTEDGSVPVDWAYANLGDGVRTGDTVHWSSGQIESLESLDSEQSGVIDLSIPINSSLSDDDADSFTINVTLTINKVGDVISTRTLESTPIVISMNSDTRVGAHARYFSEGGAAIGSGPLPPEVGETTSFRVYWSMANSLHTLENVKMTTTIPQDVTWLDTTDTDIGTVSYNATTRLVTWTIPKLITSIENAGAWFEIAINPSDADVGRFLKLTNTTSMSATDIVTSESMSKTIDILTTELSLDDFAVGQGVVID
ncbi:MAG: hypothetical protein HQ488_00360 [Parcubacteria group bacterium]|nr:hypothetical protein [Parcubacteria group bacterium]